MKLPPNFPPIKTLQIVQGLQRKYYETLSKEMRNSMQVASQMMAKNMVFLASESFKQIVKAHTDSETTLASYFKDEKVFFIPFLLDWTMPDLYEGLEKNEWSVVKLYDSLFSNEENINRLIMTWDNNPHFSKRINILQKCLRSHLEKDYELSVPIFYIQVEGICKSYLNINTKIAYNNLVDFFTGTLKKNLGKEFSSHSNLFKFASPDFLAKTISSQIFQEEEKYNNQENDYPNRHRIMHGLDTEYYKKPYASLRCILLLDMLYEVTSEIKEQKPQ